MDKNEALQAECDRLFQMARDHESISYTFAPVSSGGALDAPSRIQTPLYLGVSSEGMVAFSEAFLRYTRGELERLLNLVEVQRESAKREEQSVRYAHWNNIAVMIAYALAELLNPPEALGEL